MKHDNHARRAAYGIVLAAGAAVFINGTATSFDTLAQYADEKNWLWGPSLPLCLDLGIFALLLLDWLRPNVFLRASAWSLTAGTVFANGATTDGNWKDRALHALMPLIAVIIVEAARHLRDDPSRMDRIRLSRWVLSPIRTARLWRRMVLWEVTSYTEALARESAILHARTVLAGHYAERSWRRTRKRVPLMLRHQLATGQLPSSVLHSLDPQTAVRAWVTNTLAELAPEPAPVPVCDHRTEPDPIPDPADVDRERWDLIWVRQDSIRPKDIPEELFASAIGVARREYEQVGAHITNEALRVRLRTAKGRADAMGRVIRSAFESGPVLPDSIPDSPPTGPVPVGEEPGPVQADIGPTGPVTGLNGYELAARTGGGES